MGLTMAVLALEMPPSPFDGSVPITSASQAHLRLGKQFVDAVRVKADDDLIADDDGRSAEGSSETLRSTEATPVCERYSFAA